MAYSEEKMGSFCVIINLMGAQESVYRGRIDSGRSVGKNQVVISKQYQRMSRNNVFKLSGNMALGGQDNYPSNDFQNIKSSLKLLKSKQPQKKSQTPLEPANLYGGSYSSNSNQRQPVSRKPLQQDYPSYNYQPTRNQAPSYKDSYHQMEQHYPKDVGQKKKYTQNYEEPIQPPPRERNNIRTQKQPPKPSYSYKPSYEEEQYRMPEPRRGGGGGYQEKTIKEVNRENRAEIIQYDPSELVMCRAGCGRKFNPDSISKHEAVCKKVFQKKRKEFNTQNQRLVANEQVKLMKKGAVVEKKIEQKKAKEKIPKWKAESLQLRAGLKQARGDGPTKEEQKMLDVAQKSNYTKCHICGRSFNEEAAKRHIPFCEAQAKKNQMRRR